MTMPDKDSHLIKQVLEKEKIIGTEPLQTGIGI